MSGGYAAGYYSYKVLSYIFLLLYNSIVEILNTTFVVQWAEVLSADAFSAFEDAGLDDIKVYIYCKTNHITFNSVFQICKHLFVLETQAVKETGQRFRNTILALGGGKAPLQVNFLIAL